MPLLTVNPHARPQLVSQVQALMQREGLGLRAACAAVGIAPASFLRWSKQVEVHGTVVDGKPTGRVGAFDRMTDDECNALRHWHLVKGSLPLAVEFFVDDDAACGAETRLALQALLDKAASERKPINIPPSLRKAGAVSDEEHAIFRGKKAASDYDVIERRGLTIKDAQGRILPLMPNSIWESDDMSSNEPFRFVGADGQERVGRQSLFTVDVFSARWLGFDAIGRERDAYRVEDIADHMRELVTAWGLPMVWRLERGVWESHWLHGIDLGNGQTWGGLGDLVSIEHTWRTRGKGTVESSFNLLQDLIAGESETIGRVRGEFEAGTRHYLRAQSGQADSLAKFWTMQQYAERMAAAMDRFNHRPKKRLAHGQDMVVAAELYAQAVRRDCPASQMWRFNPQKKLATVRNGAVEVTETVHYKRTFRFALNGIVDGLYLPHGLRVAIAFHPGYPERGVHVFNADSTALNREGWTMGEPLVVGQYMPMVHNVNLSDEPGEFGRKKKGTAAMRGEFRAIAKAGSAGRKVTTARDGTGNALVMATGQTSGVPPQPLSTGGQSHGLDRGAGLGGPAPTTPARRTPFSDTAEIDRLEAKLRARGDLAEDTLALIEGR